MKVLIDNRQTRHPIVRKAVQRKAQAILSALACPEGELSLLLVDDARIAQLNTTYLQRQGPTNVIAFPMREGAFAGLHPQVLGDVVISMDTCAREAQEAGIAMEQRFDQLLVHGILHLFGYDHVHAKAQARVMEAKSEQLLAMLSQAPPPAGRRTKKKEAASC